MINISIQAVWEWTVQQLRQQCHDTSQTDARFHLAAGREGSCSNALCLGINNTVSGFLDSDGFGVGLPEATVSVTVEVEEGLSMPRSCMIASRLAYFLASWGNTGSMYLCVLGTVSRGGLVGGAGLGTIIFVTVIIPDCGTGEGVMDDVEGVGDVSGVEEGGDVVIVDELDLLEELDELAGDFVRDVLERKADTGVFGSVEVVGLVVEGREAGGGGLAETVRGGKIVE